VVAGAGAAGAAYFEQAVALAKTAASAAVQRAAVEAVAATAKGKEAEATSALADALGHKDCGVRGAAARGLGELKAESCVPQLGGLAADNYITVRGAAMDALAALGPKAGSQAEAVAANLKGPMLRACAIHALGKLGASGAAYAAEIALYLEDSDAYTRLAVAEALGDMKDSVPDNIVDQIAQLLNHQSDRFRATAAIALGSLGMAKAGKHVDSIVKMLRENTMTAAQPLLAPNCAAAVALGKLGAKSDEVAYYLGSKKPEMRAAACQSLADMGKAGAGHAKAIAACLEDEVLEVRPIALAALEKLKDTGLGSEVLALMDDAKKA